MIKSNYTYIILIILFFISCKREKCDTKYFNNIYEKDTTLKQKYYCIEYKLQKINSTFSEPLQMQTYFGYKPNNKLTTITNEVDSIRYGEQIFFFDNKDCIEKYKFYNGENTYSYALYFDENGKIIKTEGTCLTDYIATRDSLRIYEIEYFFSKFNYDDLRVYLKINDNGYKHFDLVKTNFSPFIYALTTDMRNEVDRGRIYLKYELKKGNKILNQFDTLRYNKGKIW